MIEVGDEARDRALEVDIVLPEGVVGVDEQSLVDGTPLGLVGALIEGDHRLIIRRFCRPGLPRWRRRCHAWGMSGPVGVCQIGRNGYHRCCTTRCSKYETSDS